MLALVHPGAGDLRRFAQEDSDLSQMATVTRIPAQGQNPVHTQDDPENEGLRDYIVETLASEKAEEIVTIDLRGKTSIADYMVICSGRSSRQVSALAERLVERLKAGLGRVAKVEGKDQGDWVLLDTGDVIIHIFRPEVRDFYQLEKLWMAPPAQT